MEQWFMHSVQGVLMFYLLVDLHPRFNVFRYHISNGLGVDHRAFVLLFPLPLFHSLDEIEKNWHRLFGRMVLKNT